VRTGKGLSIQTWCIAPKIKQVDDLITRELQEWIFEVHPEISFWALNGQTAIVDGKKTKTGRDVRTRLLAERFPEIPAYLQKKPSKVGKDDLLDAAVAAWSALRRLQGNAKSVSPPEVDAKGLLATIQY
jgi:predicted RNase H-like nuclease